MLRKKKSIPVGGNRGVGLGQGWDVIGCTPLREVSAGVQRVACFYFQICSFVAFGGTGSHCCARGPSLVAASGGYCSPWYSGLSVAAPLAVEHESVCGRGFSRCGTRFTCPEACGIFPEQGLNPGPLPWQAESLPLDYQGSLRVASLKEAPFYSHGVPCLGPMPTEYSHFNGILKTSLRLLNAE